MLDPLALQRRVGGVCLRLVVWVLGTELRSSERAGSALNRCAISLAFQTDFKNLLQFNF